MEEKEVNTIDIAQLGAEIGMEAKEQTLPNGKVVKSLVWDQENLLKAVNAVKHLSEEGKPVRITGAAPAWLVSALTHTVHPCPLLPFQAPWPSRKDRLLRSSWMYSLSHGLLSYMNHSRFR